jgi:hypothetical protein
MKKLSLKGLADFMTAPEVKRRKIIHDYKYPSDDEAKAKRTYYREARDRIVAYHRGAHESVWLVEQSAQLDNVAAMSTGQTKTRLRHNARALRAYARNYATRIFEVLDDAPLALHYADVRVSVFPDLHVRESGKEKIIKLEFSNDTVSEQLVKIVSQGMYEAAEQAGMNLAASCVLYLDVTHGVEHKGARIGARMRSNIEAACLNVSAIWDSI